MFPEKAQVGRMWKALLNDILTQTELTTAFLKRIQSTCLVQIVIMIWQEISLQNQYMLVPGMFWEGNVSMPVVGNSFFFINCFILVGVVIGLQPEIHYKWETGHTEHHTHILISSYVHSSQFIITSMFLEKGRKFENPEKMVIVIGLNQRHYFKKVSWY